MDEWAAEIIICLLIVVKCDLGDVAESMYHDLESPFECIFYILHFQKSDLDEIAEVIF
jgi:hypothetical protein